MATCVVCYGPHRTMDCSRARNQIIEKEPIMDPIHEPRSQMKAASCSMQQVVSINGHLTLRCLSSKVPGFMASPAGQRVSLDVCQICPHWREREAE